MRSDKDSQQTKRSRTHHFVITGAVGGFAGFALMEILRLFHLDESRHAALRRKGLPARVPGIIFVKTSSQTLQVHGTEPGVVK